MNWFADFSKNCSFEKTDDETCESVGTHKNFVYSFAKKNSKDKKMPTQKLCHSKKDSTFEIKSLDSPTSH